MISFNSLAQTPRDQGTFVDESLNVENINLTNCDREPIHLPNAIQPHGLLIIFNANTLEIVKISANIKDWSQYTAELLNGKTLTALFDRTQIQLLLEHLSKTLSGVTQPLELELTQDPKNKISCYGMVQYSEPFVTLELESVGHHKTFDYFHFFDQVKAPVDQLQRTQTLSELCDVAVQEVQKITGFDRVMVYQFHPDGSGSVIAEVAQEDAVPYLGLRYPSTDIPRQAKQLYARSWLRIIPDVAYAPVPLIDCSEMSLSEPLDMSHIGLRSVSLIHLEYLANMGVSASMSISLLHEGQLWGLIACHHNEPKRLEMPIRTCCEFIGQVMSSELIAKERFEALKIQLHQKSVLAQLEKAMTSAQTLAGAFSDSSVALLNLVNASGVAFIDQDAILLMGDTPNSTQVKILMNHLEPCFQENSIYSTTQLSQLVSDKQAFISKASGVLGLAISKAQNIYLLWFRPELPQLVNWAGNPQKPESVDEDGQPFLSPRKSFERWVETVLFQSEPWTSAELDSALELRSSIIELVLQKADELARVNLELARSNEDLAAFAYVASHDLKAPLRAIANLASWIQEDLDGKVPDETQNQLDLLQSRVYRMDDMIQGLLQYARAGHQSELIELISIPQLIHEILDSLDPPPSFQILVPTFAALYQTNTTLLKQVLTNLLSNAIKYINRPDGRITVEIVEDEKALRFLVSDNGPGIEAIYHEKIFQMFQTLQGRDEIESTGIGLAIVKKVVTTQGGEIQLRSVVGQGSTFIFTWPHISPIVAESE